MGEPHEPGLGRLQVECAARGIYANTRHDGSWWWWESEFGVFGTPDDKPPIGSFGPFPTCESALRDALRNEVQS